MNIWGVTCSKICKINFTTRPLPTFVTLSFVNGCLCTRCTVHFLGCTRCKTIFFGRKEPKKEEGNQRKRFLLFFGSLTAREAFLERGEDASNVAVTPIPAQTRLTDQIIQQWQPFKDLKQTFALSGVPSTSAFERSSAVSLQKIALSSGRKWKLGITGRGSP